MPKRKVIVDSDDEDDDFDTSSTAVGHSSDHDNAQVLEVENHEAVDLSEEALQDEIRQAHANLLAPSPDTRKEVSYTTSVPLKDADETSHTSPKRRRTKSLTRTNYRRDFSIGQQLAEANETSPKFRGSSDSEVNTKRRKKAKHRHEGGDSNSELVDLTAPASNDEGGGSGGGPPKRSSTRQGKASSQPSDMSRRIVTSPDFSPSQSQSKAKRKALRASSSGPHAQKLGSPDETIVGAVNLPAHSRGVTAKDPGANMMDAVDDRDELDAADDGISVDQTRKPIVLLKGRTRDPNREDSGSARGTEDINAEIHEPPAGVKLPLKQSQHDELIAEDMSIGLPMEQYKPRPSRSRSRTSGDAVGDGRKTETATDESMDDKVKSSKPDGLSKSSKKQRGRPKKDAEPDSLPIDEDAETQRKSSETSEPAVPDLKTSKKRGRPSKKSSSMPDIAAEKDEHNNFIEPDTKHTEAPVESKEPLHEVDPNVLPITLPDDPQATPDPAQKLPTPTKPPNTEKGRVSHSSPNGHSAQSFRVGLSKRARIQPLLKIVRK